MIAYLESSFIPLTVIFIKKVLSSKKPIIPKEYNRSITSDSTAQVPTFDRLYSIENIEPEQLYPHPNKFLIIPLLEKILG